MALSPKQAAGRQLVFALGLLAVALTGYLVTRGATHPAQTEQSTTTVATSTATSSVPVASSTVPAPIVAAPEARPVPGPAVGATAIEGTYVCLPHRDTSGPQTLECALGLQADDGAYYALSSRGAIAESQTATTPTGARVRVTGSVAAVSAGNAEWQRYAVSGVMDVATFTRL